MGSTMKLLNLLGSNVVKMNSNTGGKNISLSPLNNRDGVVGFSPGGFHP